MRTEALQLMWAIARKELAQVARDRLTLALLLGVPLLQLVLFGYAINLHPQAMPTVVVAGTSADWAEHAVAQLEATGYFRRVATLPDRASADRWLLESRAQFALVVPDDVPARLQHGEAPRLELIADATDPLATAAALHAVAARPGAAPAAFSVERRFNPAADTALHIVPGLLGVILTLTLTLLAALTIVREREHGTWEGLLATPIPPPAVLLGKLLPYWLLGFVQAAVILALAALLFDVPWRGTVPGVVLATGAFMLANLGLGVTISLLAKSQMQAMQMGVFFYLPSILLSGFMFPFHAMPRWAQWIGEVLPLTHFLRVVRGALLKGADDALVLSLSWPIAVFAAAAFGGALALYRRTLD